MYFNHKVNTNVTNRTNFEDFISIVYVHSAIFDLRLFFTVRYVRRDIRWDLSIVESVRFVQRTLLLMNFGGFEVDENENDAG